MQIDRRVVVVALDEDEAARWRAALPLLSSTSSDGYVWHVLDCGRPQSRLGRWLRLHRRTAAADAQAARLEQLLNDPPFMGRRALDDPQITLVGSRQACHVMRDFALRVLARGGDVRSIRRFRQFVLVNPRHGFMLRALVIGAVLAVMVQVGAPILAKQLGAGDAWSNAVQALATCLAAVLPLLLSLFLSDEARRKVGMRIRLDYSLVADTFREKVEEGAKSCPGTWPIPVQTLVLGGEVPGDAQNARHVADAVVRPVAHKNLYDVELFEVSTIVRRITQADVPMHIQALAPAERRAAVFGDNEAINRKAVTFSAQSAEADSPHLDNWMLKYGTYDGILVADVVHPNNLWAPMYRERDYERRHAEYRYEFAPHPSRTYEIRLRIYGGYTGDEQRAHSHLRADTYYRCMRETLDLSAYTTDGWRIASPPRVTFVSDVLPPVDLPERHAKREIVGLSCRCTEQDRTEYERLELPVQCLGPGVFRWEMYGVRDGGVLEYTYRVERGDDAAGV